MKTEWTKRQQKAHRKAWVKALRSGKYQQAQSRLRDNDTGAMCCLGVACEVSRLGTWTESGVYAVGRGRENRNHVYLPEPVRRWLGLAHREGAFDGKSLGPNHLSSKNDSGSTFAEIADIIEAEPEGLIAVETVAS